MTWTMRAADLTADEDGLYAEVPMDGGIARGVIQFSLIGDELVDLYLSDVRYTVRGDQDVHLREAS